MTATASTVLVREIVRPPWTFRLGRPSMDGLLRRRGDGLVRLLHVAGQAVVVAVAQRGADRVVFAARAASESAAADGIARMRFALAVDDDLSEFHARFRDDPVIGRTVRARPELRVRRNPDPFETLAWAITEQLIEFDRAVLIQRALIRALGARCATTGLRDSPPAAIVAAQAPALLESFGLAPKRALALRRAAREIASGRVPLVRAAPGGGVAAGSDFARLLAIPDIGPWTVEMLALHGLGRLDAVPAGDLGYLKLVGHVVTGNPRAIADEDEVRGFFSAYAPWAGLAGEYLRLAGASGRLVTRAPTPPAPRRAGTRWSAAATPKAVA